jgi:hypothetical protein
MNSTDLQGSTVATTMRIRLAVQLLGTIAILAWVPGNAAKLISFLVLWTLGFGRVSRRELLIMIGVNVLFVFMNYGALGKGVFRFSSPDAMGMPAYEFVMWGFYTLNTLRFLGGKPPQGKTWLALVMAALFALPFSTVSDAGMLTMASGLVLVIGLALYHEPMDFAYVAYMVIMGALIEYVGVATGQWTYPGSPPGGVPLWFITMWGGVGLFTRRLLLPLRCRGDAELCAANPDS